MTTIHYADQTFELAESEDDRQVGEQIQLAHHTGGWVDVLTPAGGVSLLVSPGVAIWLDRRKSPTPSVAFL